MLRYLVLFCSLSVIKLDKCCSNSNKKILNCELHQLHVIPNCENQIHIKKFILSYNGIENLQNYSLSRYSNLIELKLDNNNMNVIQIDAFKGLSNLQNLYLQHNMLTHLEPELLSELSSLKVLRLNDNQFIKIPDISNSAFSQLYLGNNQIRSFNFPSSYLNCTNLRKIDLKNNLGKIPDKNHFYNLKQSQIESLYLQNNKINNVSTEIFYFIRKRLRAIYINQNPSISDDGFQKILDSFDHVRHKKTWHLDIFASNIGLRNLSLVTFTSLQHVKTQKLDLSENFIETLPTDFNKTQSLLELHLDHNKLKSIQSNQFNKMKSLRILNFNHNLIVFINNNGFVGLISLRKLDLSFNQISVLNLSTLNPLLNLKELLINGNKILVLNSCLNRGISYLAYFDWSANQIIQLNKSRTYSICFSDTKCDNIPKHKIRFQFKLDINLVICMPKYNDTNVDKSTKSLDSRSKLSYLKYPLESKDKTVLIIIITVVAVVFIMIGLGICGGLVFRWKTISVKSPKKKQTVKNVENYYESIDTDECAERA